VIRAVLQKTYFFLTRKLLEKCTSKNKFSRARNVFQHHHTHKKKTFHCKYFCQAKDKIKEKQE
jgi:hypothetical protein